ncbi:MAG TPA: GNAT family N-acetyltransferase [Thermoplasmata archaeon]|nr:GNAT family N-acetyltransferase [Thermoplasmata archaeon]
MPARPGSIHQGLDLAWLEAVSRHDPISHAYALWDARQEPERTRFVRWDAEDGNRSYLLLWYGDPNAPVAHWVGRTPSDLELAREIPPNAQVAIVPERVAWAVLQRRRANPPEPLLVLGWDPARPATAPSGSAVRRLDGDDRADVLGFARRYRDRLTAPYLTLDLGRDVAWGAFDGDRLVGIARAAVRLEGTWIVGGIFVAPSARRRGHGRDLTRAAAASAASAGARAALYVRESNSAARALYEELGFRQVDRKVWIDFATGSPSPTDG